MSQSAEFHNHPFDEPTLMKLELYRQYLREWFPVFISSSKQYFSSIFVFDFFCGPGYDGTLPPGRPHPGSPIIALEELDKALETRKTLGKLEGVPLPHVTFVFNDLDSKKVESLRQSLKYRLPRRYSSIVYENLSFKECFTKYENLMGRPDIATLAFIDQFGVSEVTSEIFTRLINKPNLDFLFYIAASIVNRMKEMDCIRSKLPEITPPEYQEMKGTTALRYIAKAYQRMVTQDNVFLSHFAFKRGANVNGLIFGSHNILGIEKFLQRAWKLDPFCGEAGFDIDKANRHLGDDYLPLEIEGRPVGRPTKLLDFEERLRASVLDKTIKTTEDVYLFAMAEGFLASQAKKVIVEMINEGKLRNRKRDICVSYDAYKKKKSATLLINVEVTDADCL